MFISCDNFVQSPTQSQNFNRYSYALGNPLKFTDPDGNNPMLLALIIWGAYFGGAQANTNGQDVWRGMALGAASAAAGGWAGGAVASAIGTGGFFGGAAAGATGGFVGGFVGGAGNALMNGANFGQILSKGFKSGIIGGIGGGILGGLVQGVSSLEHGRKFWSGTGSTYDELAPANAECDTENSYYGTCDGVEYNNEYAQGYSNDHYGNVKGIDLHADGSTPNGYTTHGDAVYNRRGAEVRGSTVLGEHGRYNVYLYKAAFTSREQLFLTMGHEYLHVGFNLSGLKNMNSQHATIREFELAQSHEWGGFHVGEYSAQFEKYSQFYNPAYNYRSLGFSVLTLRP
jgi:hypothetical protein